MQSEIFNKMNESLLSKDITRMLCEHDFGVLATYGGDYPYTSFISLDFSADERYLIFPTMRRTRKYTNLLHEARASVLLDNRSCAEKNPQNVYALTVLGTTREVDANLRPALEQHFLQHHPNLADFLSQPQTALIQLVLKKIIIVERFQNVREFQWPLE